MIREEYCSFEACRLLKEAGFPQDDEYKAYDADGDLYAHLWEVESECYAGPTQAQAMRWLREYRRIHIEIRYRIYDQMWDSLLRDMDGKIAIPQDDLNYVRNCQDFWVAFPTYEAAAEAGIQAACKYLTGSQK